MQVRRYAVIACLAAAAAWTRGDGMETTRNDTELSVVASGLICGLDARPTPSCHASTIADTGDGLVAAWFGGTGEKHPDVGIWVARRAGGAWGAAAEVADGVLPDGTRHPCWNPVLFRPKTGPLMLFYKVGPDPRSWWGMVMTSDDGGRTWREPRRLGRGPLGPLIGPVKNKPVELADGTLLCPSSTELDGWRVHLERSVGVGETWTVVGPLNDGREFGAIQPSILVHPAGRLQLLCRSRQGVVTQAWSEDNGASWGPMTATVLPNPNSGTDAVTLADGRHLIVYNHTTKGRSPLNVALSDDGVHWRMACVLEDQPGEYSYPAVIQSADGRVHITYTYRREAVKYVAMDVGGR